MNFERKILLSRMALLLVVLVLWEVSAQFEWINTFWVSSPTKIIARSHKLIVEGTILFHMGITLLEAGSGLMGGIIVGVILGVVLGLSKQIGQIFEPFVMALNSLPRVALAPLLVMYVGIGFASKFLLAFSLVVVIIMVNTYEGIRSVEPNLINAMRILGASQYQLFKRVYFPNCMPWIFAGTRVSVSFAIVGAIVGEFISSQAGIGYMIDKASGAYDTTGIFVPLLFLMLFGVFFDILIVKSSAYFLRWRPVKPEDH